MASRNTGCAVVLRGGVNWLLQLLTRIESGEGQMKDIDLLLSVCGNIGGKTLCPFGDAEIAPVVSTIKHFRHEFAAMIKADQPAAAQA